MTLMTMMMKMMIMMMTMMIMIITSGGGDDDCKHRMDHVGGPIEKLAILESCRFLAPGLGAGWQDVRGVMGSDGECVEIPGALFN
jgi:hypothetical protein